MRDGLVTMPMPIFANLNSNVQCSRVDTSAACALLTCEPFLVMQIGNMHDTAALSPLSEYEGLTLETSPF